jgi:hypothetical protein
MTLVGLATSSGVYENLEPVEQSAGGRIAVTSLLGAVAASVALGGLVLGSRYWATLGGCGVIATGAASLVVGELWVADEHQKVVASLTVVLVGLVTIIVGRLMRQSAS